MAACPSCGRDNPDDARFCNSCGAALGVSEVERESRKVVTVLFCDLVGSTSLGESTDPEALRARMRRYFEDLRAILERHGGTVEKFVGDAVMAVFGIPVSHEDDALRAVRAAWEMRVAVSAHGLEARIGVNTGEVVVGGESETLVTGDAVNVAARLEQAAPAGEVLIGSETRLLVRDAVDVEAVEPLSLKGKADPVAAFRVNAVLEGAEGVTRHLERPLVGRERERQRLRSDYEDAVADATCRIFTLLGPAGIGKSRLVADFLEYVSAGADVLRGRCLPYGEGITYWPLVEILIAAGIDPDTVLGTSAAETQLSFRRLLEERAGERPQVVVFDDLQWAEPTFLDLVEHVADLSRDAPIFLLCVARTELLDKRPGWGGGKLNATSLLLEPLDHDDCEELIGNLLEHAGLDNETRGRIVVASDGNPLFIEEMLAMVRERTDGDEIVVPPTIHALLQARLDALGGDERVVIERGSVEGEVFHRGSVARLSPASVESEVESHLSTLVRKELIRPDRATFPDDEAYRFRHLLIRDAAYESLPKAARADLHEQFANWLEQHEIVERDEILGYHLEQAHRYRSELYAADTALTALAERASKRLAAAGHAALDHGDFQAARTFLERAMAVLPDDEQLVLAPELAMAYWETGDGRFLETVRKARTSADPLTRARAGITLAALAFSGTAELPAEEREDLREEARAAFEAADDQQGMAWYWWAVAEEATNHLHAAEAIAACERGLAALETVGASHTLLGHVARRRMRNAYMPSSVPVDVAIDRIQALTAPEHGPLAEAQKMSLIGMLLAMRGELTEARELVRRARDLLGDSPMIWTAVAIAFDGRVEWRGGDLDRAEQALREGLGILESLGDKAFYPTLGAELACVLYEQGRYAEADEWRTRALETTGADDLINFAFIGFVEGRLLAREGRFVEAEEVGRSVVELVEPTDYFWARTESHAHLAETLALQGKHEEASIHAARALEITGAKGDVALAARVRERLAGVGLTIEE